MRRLIFWSTRHSYIRYKAQRIGLHTTIYSTFYFHQHPRGIWHGCIIEICCHKYESIDLLKSQYCHIVCVSPTIDIHIPSLFSYKCEYCTVCDVCHKHDTKWPKCLILSEAYATPSHYHRHAELFMGVKKIQRSLFTKKKWPRQSEDMLYHVDEAVNSKIVYKIYPYLLNKVQCTMHKTVTFHFHSTPRDITE